MGVRIDSNNPAIQGATQQASRLTRGLDRLSSALRSGSDQQTATSAGVSLAEKLRTQIHQYTEQANNLQTAVTTAQAADKGMEAQAKGIAQLRDLARQASDTTLTTEQRATLNTEAQKVIAQIDQTAKDTKSGGNALLDGSVRTVTPGGHAGPTVTLQTSTAESLGLNKLDLSSTEGASAALSAANNAQVRVGQGRAALQTQSERFTQAIERRRGAESGVTALQGRLDTTDAAQQAIEQVRSQLSQNTNLAALTQGAPSTSLISKLLG